MRPVSDTWKNSIYEKRKALLLKADMLLMSGETLYLDYEPGDDDFMADGLTFEDATSNESSFDIGNAVMNTFSFRLNNANDKYTNKILTDAVIIPYVGMELSDGEIEWVKKGKFTVSDPGKRGSILSFTAYDFMQKLEIAFSSVKITYPVTIGKMAQAICTACGVTLATTTFPNSTYVISEAPAGSNYSCRQMISFIAQIAGCFARFNADGELEIKWYEAVDTENQNYHDITQYKTLETELKDITITGVKVSSYYNENSLADENGNPVVENAESGSGGYMVSISNNPLIPYGKASQVANMLADAIMGTTFRPLNLTTFYDPSMEAGDTAVITDIKGNTYSFFVTNMTAKVGSDVKIICSAQTESDNLAEQYSGAAQVILSILEATNAKFKDLAVNHLEALVGEFGYVKTRELEAEIGKFGYLTADEAAIKYATITDLKATNATIQNLTAIAITTENLEAEVAALGYATIDFANIDTAHINREKVKELFVELGMIKDAVISEGHITGYLDAVKVNANDIKTGTLSTDRLIINGSDKSIVFALNNMGALVSTSVDSLDGGILTERTVTADKIVSHSITATEITTENITGANGWINLALGTFNYGNKLSWDGNNLEIVGAVTIASLTTEALNTIKGYSTDAVNNLGIGGRNYLLGTATGKSINVNTTTGYLTTPCWYTNERKSLAELGFAVGDEITISFDWEITQNGSYDFVYGNFRAEAYGATSNSSSAYLTYLKNPVATFSADNTGGHEEFTVKLTSTTVKMHGFKFRVDKSVLTFSARNVKLEKGNKATDWSSAPEDIDQSISEASIKNWCVNGNTTYIDGSKIYTGSVTADKISVDSLEAIVAKIGGFNINDTALYNGTDSMISTTAGVYLGIDGIRQYKSADAYVNIQDGVLEANGANIKGNVYLDNGVYLKDINGMSVGDYLPIIKVDDTNIGYADSTIAKIGSGLFDLRFNATAISFPWCSYIDGDGYVTYSKEIKNTYANAFRISGNGKSVIFRKDGTAFYILLADSEDSGNNWNSYRPLLISLSTGKTNINGFVPVAGITSQLAESGYHKYGLSTGLGIWFNVFSVSVAITSGYGNLYYGSVSLDLPSSLTAIQNLQVTCGAGTGLVHASYYNADISNKKLYLWISDAKSQTTTVYINVMIIGRASS